MEKNRGSKKKHGSKLRLEFKRDELKQLIEKEDIDIYEITRQLGLHGVNYTPAQVRWLINGKVDQPRGDVLYGLCRIFKVDIIRFYV